MMKINVPYRSEYEIEREADILLAEHHETTGEQVKLPIPVDEISTIHLALRLGIADLHETFEVPRRGDQPEILGAIWMEAETILIDDSLDPQEHPSMLGRYRFSVAHELGHWRLHRPLLMGDARQRSLFKAPAKPTIVCRSSERKKPIEWQADFFASCLLMPSQRVRAGWREHLGRDRPLCLSDLRPNDRVMTRADAKIRGCENNERIALDDALLEEVAKPLARRFGVSMSAMRIRLEKLGLLVRQRPSQGSFKL